MEFTKDFKDFEFVDGVFVDLSVEFNLTGFKEDNIKCCILSIVDLTNNRCMQLSEFEDQELEFLIDQGIQEAHEIYEWLGE